MNVYHLIVALRTAKWLQKIISLSLAYWLLESLQNLKHVFPNFAFFRRRLVSEQVSGVICDHQRDAVVSVPASAQFPHRSAHSKQAFHSDRAERNQHFRLDDLDLLHQIR